MRVLATHQGKASLNTEREVELNEAGTEEDRQEDDGGECEDVMCLSHKRPHISSLHPVSSSLSN